LTLKEMYWLDIDPTQSNWWFVAGMIKPPTPVVVKPDYDNDHDEQNNVAMGVYMCIENNDPGVNKRYAPYVIRGVAPDETSWAYSAGEMTSWTGASFKITGILDNELPNNIGWTPLRWFVFDQGSFDEEYQSYIEVLDPFASDSPGNAHGWSKWRGRANVFFRWTLEDGRSSYGVEILCPTNKVSR